MPLIVKAPEAQFKTAPEGTYTAVCVDVVDLGMVESQWGAKHRCRLVWELDELDPDTGAPFMVRQDYTFTLSEKANLYRDLVAWRGRAFTPEELRGFDLESIIGKSCMLQVSHNIGSKGGTFANVSAVTALPKKSKPLEPSGTYVRRATQSAAGSEEAPF